MFDPAAEDLMPEADPAADIGAIAYVRDRLHARTLVDADGITALAVAATRRDDPGDSGYRSLTVPSEVPGGGRWRLRIRPRSTPPGCEVFLAPAA